MRHQPWTRPEPCSDRPDACACGCGPLPGQLVAERRGHNMVLRGGAAVIAGLFAGKAGSEPINFVEVGFGQELAAPDATSLTPPNPSLPVAALRSPVSRQATLRW